MVSAPSVHCLSHLRCLMLGDSGNAALLGGITNATLGGLANVLPASKAEVRNKDADQQTELINLEAKNANLKAEVAALNADRAQKQAVIETVILQINKITPVSGRIDPVTWLCHASPPDVESLYLCCSLDTHMILLQGYDGTNGLNGNNGTTGPAGFPGTRHALSQ